MRMLPYLQYPNPSLVQKRQKDGEAIICKPIFYHFLFSTTERSVLRSAHHTRHLTQTTYLLTYVPHSLIVPVLLVRFIEYAYTCFSVHPTGPSHLGGEGISIGRDCPNTNSHRILRGQNYTSSAGQVGPDATVLLNDLRAFRKADTFKSSLCSHSATRDFTARFRGDWSARRRQEEAWSP